VGTGPLTPLKALIALIQCRHPPQCFSGGNEKRSLLCYALAAASITAFAAAGHPALRPHSPARTLQMPGRLCEILPQQWEGNMTNSSKKQRFVWLFGKMYQLAKENSLELQLGDTWAHSLQVWSTACKLLDEILLSPLPEEVHIDVDFVEFACFVHDLGRMVTGSLASEERCPNHGFSHGPIGAAIFRRQDFFEGCPSFSTKYQDHGQLQEALARICERHIGCVGLSRDNYSKLLTKEKCHKLSYEPKWDVIAGIEGGFVSTLEEKIVGIADFLTKAHMVYPSQGSDPGLFFKGEPTTIQERMKEARDWDTFPVIKEVIREMQELSPAFLHVV
jgi:hypothetical protein